MTWLALFRALLRTWYVVLIGAILTLCACLAALGLAPPAYYARMEVLFVAAEADRDTLRLQPSNGALVPFVAAVERSINGSERALRLNSRAAPLHGTGVRQGVRVAIPNYGSQWVSSYPVPSLVVEVVDASPAAVEAEYERVLAEIRTTAEALQQGQGVPAGAEISFYPVESELGIADVGATRQEKARSLLAVAVLGIGFTAAAAVTWDRRMQRRARVPTPLEFSGAAAGP